MAAVPHTEAVRERPSDPRTEPDSTPTSSNGPTSPPQPQFRSAAEIADRALSQALHAPQPTSDAVATALEELDHAEPVSAFRAALAALSAAERSDPAVAYDPISPDQPHLLVRHPRAAYLRPVVDYLHRGRMAELLAKPIDPEAIVLMPFVYSTAGKEKIDREVPPSRMVQGTGARRLLGGDFDPADKTLFQGLRGQTVVVVGHIVGRGADQAFEVQGRGGKRYVPLAAIAQASRDLGFNFVPLGCETGDSSPIGTVTKINDVEALKAFGRAIHGSSRTMGQLLANLSAPELEIAIDLAHLDHTDVIPVRLRDADGRPYDGGPMPGSAPAPPPIATPVPVPPPPAATCDAEGRTSRQMSGLADWVFDDGRWAWFWAWSCACLFAIALGVAEMPSLRAVPAGERGWDAATILVQGIATWGAILAMAGGAYDSHPVSWFATLLCAVSPFGVIIEATKEYPNYRLLRVGIWIAAPVAWLPFLALIGLEASAAACWIKPMPQL